MNSCLRYVQKGRLTHSFWMYSNVSRVHSIDIANVLHLDPDEQQPDPRLLDRLLKHPIVHHAPAFFESGAIAGRPTIAVHVCTI